jgi:hypothetical protein
MNRNTTPAHGSGLRRLFTEIEAYLAVVDAMRREGIEPCWAGERHGLSRERHVCAGPDRRFQREVWG